jgi:hypothetical protein
MEKWRAAKSSSVSFFRNPLILIPILSQCPSSLGVRESISVAIPFDLLRKKRSIDAKDKCTHGNQEGGSYHLFVIVCLPSLFLPFVVRLYCRWKNRSDEEAKKMQKNRIDGKVILVARAGFEMSVSVSGSPVRLVRPWRSINLFA